MNDIEESLFQALNEIVEKKDMRVVNISIGGLAKSPSIQIIIDSTQGVSLDDCSFVSKVTDDIIKVNVLSTTPIRKFNLIIIGIYQK